MDGIQSQKFVRSASNNVPYMYSTSPINRDNKEKDIKDGDKKSMNALKWAGIIAAGALAVGGTIYAIKKGKPLKLEKVTDEAGKTVNKVGGKVLTYSKDESGKIVAMLDNKKAEGILKFTTPGGATLTYKDGILHSAIKSGENGFTKIYNKKGLLTRATFFREGGKKDIFQYVRNKKTGKLLKIKNKAKGDTIFNYGSDGKFTNATRKGETLLSRSEIARNEASTAWADSVGDMSSSGVLKAQLEDKIADCQITCLKDAYDLGYTEEQLRAAGVFDRLK